MSPTETIEEAYARLNQDLADALEKIKRLTTEVEQLKHMQPTVDPSLIANAAKMTELSEKALAADIEYRKTVLSKPNYNDRRWGAALAIYCEQECEVDEAWTRAEEFMDAEPADSYRTREPAPISEERHNREFPMQPVVMVGNVIRFKANPLVRILLDAYPNGLNGLCGKDPDRDEAAWSQLAQLIGYSVSGYRDLSYAEDRVSEAAGVESAIILKQFREPAPTPPAEPKPEPEWLTELEAAIERLRWDLADGTTTEWWRGAFNRVVTAVAAAREACK